MPKPTWLIKPYLDVGSLAVTFGEPGSMKSFLAIDQGLCIATGIDWHGCPVKQGTVFYIAGEGLTGLSCRVKAWEITHNIDLKKVPFFLSSCAAQLLDPSNAQMVAHFMDELRERHGNPTLIVIDTLNRNFGPGDESSTLDMGKFIAAIDKYLRHHYGCTVLIIHHTGWSAMDRARGSSALRAACDWEYRVARRKGSSSLTFSCTKAKDATPPPEMNFVSEVITIKQWVSDDWEYLTSCVIKKTETSIAGNQRKLLTRGEKIAFDALLTAIKEANAQSVHISAWRKIAYKNGISASVKQDAKKKAFQRAINGLRDAGYIATENDYWWPIRDKGQEGDKYGTCPDETSPDGHN